MQTNDILSIGRRILGVAMILMGIFGTVAQLAKGYTLPTGAVEAYARPPQAGTEMPRIESARAETRAVAGTLEATLQSILTQA